jgi:hypothetical protein
MVKEDMNKNDNIVSRGQGSKENKLLDLYIKNNINVYNCNLYKDVTTKLLYYLHNTFFGSDFLKTDNDIEGHFKWCINKTKDDLHFVNIKFEPTKELYNYLYNYYLVNFFDNKPSYYNDVSVFIYYFSFFKEKDEIILLDFLSLYKMFENSFI